MSIYDVFNGGSRPFNKEEWAAQKQAQRQEAYEMIDNTCAEMMESGDSFRQYLDVQGRFDRYSVANAVLVSAQMPEATQLKDYGKWKQSRVYVNKDAQKITILEPSKEYLRDDGTKAVSYNAKVVYDISETSAKDRQEAAEPMEHLNDYLQEQGYDDTVLYDPSGFDTEARTTALDLKKVVESLLEYQWFRDIVSKSSYKATLPDESTQMWKNTNAFLDSTSDYYNGNVKGVKTGSLSDDYNLVVLYQQHGKEFLICSLGSKSNSSRYDDVNYIIKTIDESDYLSR